MIDPDDPWASGIPDIRVADVAERIDAEQAKLAIARIMKTIGQTEARAAEVLEEIIDHIEPLVPAQLADPDGGVVFATPAINDPSEMGDFYPLQFWDAVTEGY